MPEEDCLIAIDPGRSKCGIAVVDRCGGVRERLISPTESLVPTVRDLIARFRPVRLVLGNGTGSAPCLASLGSISTEISIDLIDERHTSEAARRAYLVDHLPRGFNR